jgi:hypothetical protein
MVRRYLTLRGLTWKKRRWRRYIMLMLSWRRMTTRMEGESSEEEAARPMEKKRGSDRRGCEARRRRPKMRRVCEEEVDWEKPKLDAEIRGLLSSDTSKDNLRQSGQVQERDLDGEASACEDIEPPISKIGEKGEEPTPGSGITSMMMTGKMIEVLTMLERKTSAMEKREDKIKMRMAELTKREKAEKVEERGVVHGVTRPKAFRCTVGRALMMPGLLGLAISAASSEVKSSDNFEATVKQ